MPIVRAVLGSKWLRIGGTLAGIAFLVHNVDMGKAASSLVNVDWRWASLAIVLTAGRLCGGKCRSFFGVVVSRGILFHVLRMAIKVMSSFCGCDPTKLRTSSITRVTIAAAPSLALARTPSMVRSSPNSFPSLSSASVTPSV